MRARRGVTRATGIGLVLLGAALATPAAAVQVGTTAVAAHHAVAATRPATTHAQLKVDRAGYVAVSPVDPYHGDRNAIHVAMAGGQQLTRGYVRVDTRHLPSGAKLSTLALTAPAVIGSPIDGANLTVAAPIVEACVTTATVPAALTAANAPAYDCSKGSSVGRMIDGGAEWTFALKPLAAYWQRHGDTGAALVPIASTPVATWSAAFGIHDMVATVERLVAPAIAKPSKAVAPPATSHAAAAAPPATTTVAPPPMPATQVGAPSAISNPVVAAPQTQLAASTTNDHDVLNAWPFILALCILIGLGAIGIAHRALIAEELKRDVPPIIAAIRTHPRAYGVASAALAWGLLFTGYAVVHDKSASTMPPVYSGQPVPGLTPGTTQPPGIGFDDATPAAGSGKSPKPGKGGGVSVAPGVGVPGQTVTPSANPTATEFKGRGRWETISGTRVFFPAHGGVPTADLYHGSADQIGITSKTI
ncbi:MAG: hypothetical protein ACTHK4_13745, partial [Mycobacteriales bacterium]